MLRLCHHVQPLVAAEFGPGCGWLGGGAVLQAPDGRLGATDGPEQAPTGDDIPLNGGWSPAADGQRLDSGTSTWRKVSKSSTHLPVPSPTQSSGLSAT
jgi:hypothetical protein